MGIIIDKNHTLEDFKMENNICKLDGFGTCKVGADWLNYARNGYNRLYYINGGTGWYVKNGERIPFFKDKLYFIPFYANVVTFSSVEDNLDHTYAGFYLTPPIISTDVFCLDPEASPYIQSAVDTFRTLCKTRNIGAPERTLLKSIVIYLTNAAAQTSHENLVADALIIQALNLMHSTVAEGLTVAEIAKRCNLSTNGFIKRFAKCVGETPYSYIKKLKIRTALVLRDGGATLEEAAQSAGYSDACALLHAMAKEELC